MLINEQIMADNTDNKFSSQMILEQNKKLLLDDLELRYEKEVEPYLPKNSEQDALLKESRKHFYKSKEGQILVFISSSMSKVNIKSLLEEAKVIGASILLRGFIDGSFIKITNYIKEIYSSNENLGGILIDPASFKDFNITQVPSFVFVEKTSDNNTGITKDSGNTIVEKINKYKKLVGNITLSKASELFENHRKTQNTSDKKQVQDRERKTKNSIFDNQMIEDLGVYGAAFDIKEQDFEEMITQKLTMLEMQGKVEEFNRLLAKKITTRIQNPPRVFGIEKSKKNRRFLVDVSKVIKKDIKDLRGNIIAKKGTKINPLDHTQFAKDIYFIDGEDLEQVYWLKEQKKDKQERIIILIGGSPIQLQEDLKERMYFDLRGEFSKKFNITKVPSIVSGHDHMVKVEEIAI